MNKGT